MQARSRLTRSWDEYRFYIERGIDAVRALNAVRRWWKGADEMRKWEVRTTVAWLTSGIPTLGIGIVWLLVLFFYHVPFNDSFGEPTGEVFTLILGCGMILIVSSRKVYRFLERRFDLEVPIYICIQKHCCGNLNYIQTEKAGRVCPYCHGKVRLLTADEKRR